MCKCKVCKKCFISAKLWDMCEKHVKTKIPLTVWMPK